MKKEILLRRLNELIGQADDLLANISTHTSQMMGTSYYVDNAKFQTYRVSSMSLLRSVFGENHPIYQTFLLKAPSNAHGKSNAETSRAILLAAKDEIEGGWVNGLAGLISAQIFTDILDQAEHLLVEGYKDPVAVMTGSVLEQHLRQLCHKHEIDVQFENKKGRLEPKKADLLNSELKGHGVYNALDQKQVTAWLDLRNRAAHGHYNEYTQEQVETMIQGVINFISRNSI